MAGLSVPLQLQHGETEVILEDYLMDPRKITSFTLDPSLSGLLSEDRKTLTIRTGETPVPLLTLLTIRMGDHTYDILVRAPRKVSHTFVFDPGGETLRAVQIAGEMNGWNPAAGHMDFTEGIWKLEMWLNPGRYQYQMVVDGNWILDPANPDSADNNMGGYNSVVDIGLAEDSEKPRLSTISHRQGRFTLHKDNQPDRLFVFWQNHCLGDPFIRHKEALVEVSIPVEARGLDRSFIRVYSSNDVGVSNDLLIPLERDEVVSDSSMLNRFDWEAAVMYFLMIDRFHNGDPLNDKPLNTPEVHPKVDYHGGDLKGITRKIREGFFNDLGINTIWLSPVAQNPLGPYGQWKEPPTKFSGYHGYWPVSSSQVDFRFGSGDDLRELVSTAHQSGINVILDYVANHVHQEHPLYREHPDWATNLHLPDGSLNIEKWDEHRLTTWFDTFLPTLDLSRPEVASVMSDSALYWIKEFQLDGYRHDATKHIHERFWRALTRKLKAEVILPSNRRIYQVGETYGSRELIASYIGPGMMDAQFDFNLYDAAVSAFARDQESLTLLARSLSETSGYYGHHHVMGYITGNQDKPRFISLAGGDLKFGENSKQAGWNRNIGVGDQTGYLKMRELIAFFMTIPGIPTIYYGDEYGMPGGNDPDNRRDMKFSGYSDDEAATRDITQELIRLRRGNLALIYGDLNILEAGDETLVFTRCWFERICVVAFNKGHETRTIQCILPQRFQGSDYKVHFGSSFQTGDEGVNIDLGPVSFEILTN
ncbi:MAG: hypothetical protein JW861_09735 [Bacteroidales bacterium]|nr:hypothetical protein [Bacteroidales bacterium]